jgi:hypothetical protein
MELTTILRAWFLVNVNSERLVIHKHLVQQVHRQVIPLSKASDTYLPLLLYFGDELPAWKLNYILYILEGTTIQEQQSILCILQ